MVLITKNLDYLLPEQLSTRNAESLLIYQRYTGEPVTA
jgi:hypothetical protein